MNKKYQLELVGITYNQIESGVYALILQEVGSSRRIPIIIGFPEAQAIECKLQEVKTPRPLTHDTMVNALSAFGIKLVEVNIKKLDNGVFTADLLFSDGKDTRVIDSRSSDAIALAIRTGSPIYTTEDVLIESGFEPEENKPKASQFNLSSNPAFTRPTVKKDVGYKTMSNSQLTKAMAKAVEEENYEEAAKIKAELEKREQKNLQS
ncbi:MAG: bifunctional nuclease family protein [Bacteroides sp.]|nr:bifunctional nuclease family protein [Bacteroides sp.]